MNNVWQNVKKKPMQCLGIVGLLAVAGCGLLLGVIHCWAWYNFSAGKKALEIGAYAEAAKKLDCCLTYWPRDAEAHFLRARTGRLLGRFDLAREELNKAEELGWSADRLELESDLLRAQQGEFFELEPKLIAYAQVEDEDTASVMEVLSKAYASHSLIRAALYWGNRFVEHSPKNVAALVAAGSIHDALQNPKSALKFYQKALELQPDNEIVRRSLAEALVNFHQPEEALVHFQELKAQGLTTKPVLLGMAQCLRGLGKTEEAEAILDRLVAEYPDDGIIWRERGSLAWQGGARVEAEKCLRKAVALNPYDDLAVYALFLCLNQQKSQARRAEAAHLRARHKRLINDWTRLKHLALEGRNRDPHNPAVTFEMGAILMRLGRDEAGVRWLRRTLKLDPTHAKARKALVQYYNNLGKNALADGHH